MTATRAGFREWLRRAGLPEPDDWQWSFLERYRLVAAGRKVLAISAPAPPGRCYDLSIMCSESLRSEILPPLEWDGSGAYRGAMAEHP